MSDRHFLNNKGPGLRSHQTRSLSGLASVRYSLIDMLFVFACEAIGIVTGLSLFSNRPRYFGVVAGIGFSLCLYLALIYPFYRGLKLFPLILPRCPCCARCPFWERSPVGFQILAVCWPRVTFRCPTCNGEFAVWHNGQPGNQETWENPVLALKWPYAFGIYRRAKNPDPGAASNHGSADAPPGSAG